MNSVCGLSCGCGCGVHGGSLIFDRVDRWIGMLERFDAIRVGDHLGTRPPGRRRSHCMRC